MSADPEQVMAYVGIAPCGCIRFACVDRGTVSTDSRKEMMDCLKKGYKIERWKIERVRNVGAWKCSTSDCPFKDKTEAQKSQEKLPL